MNTPGKLSERLGYSWPEEGKWAGSRHEARWCGSFSAVVRKAGRQKVVTNTCSAGRGLGKVSAAVTRGRRLLRCLVYLDCLDWNLLSHGTTWGERGAHEPVAPQRYKNSGPRESPPVLLWLHTAPQHHSVLHWGRLHRSSVWQKPETKTCSFLAHGPRRG